MDTKQWELIAKSVAVAFPYAGSLIYYIDAMQNDDRFKAIEVQLAKIQQDLSLIQFEKKAIPLGELICLIRQTGCQNERLLINAEVCLLFMEKMNVEAQQGFENESMVEYEDAIKMIVDKYNPKDPLIAFQLVVHELDKNDLIYVHKAGNFPLGIMSIAPKRFFFAKTDSLFQSWNPFLDAKLICKEFYKPIDFTTSDEIKTKCNWETRRVNAATTFLEYNNLLEYCEDHCGGDEFVIPFFRLSPEALHFAAS
jgi:hypothetical protein